MSTAIAVLRHNTYSAHTNFFDSYVYCDSGTETIFYFKSITLN